MAYSTLRFVSPMSSPVLVPSPAHSSMPDLENPEQSTFHPYGGDPLVLRFNRASDDPGWPYLIGEPSAWHSDPVAALMKIPPAVRILLPPPSAVT